MNIFSILVTFTFVAVAAVNSVPVDDTTAAASDHDDTTIKSTDHDEILRDSVYCSPNGTLAVKPEIMEKTELMEKVAHCKPTSEHYGTEEGEKHPNCAYFCFAKMGNLLGEDGLPSKDKYDAYTNLAFPEAYQEKAKELAHSCIDELAGKIDLTDEKCEGAAAFSDCVHKVWAMEC